MHRRIFEEIGINSIIKMCSYQTPKVRENMCNVLINLIQLDQNKVNLIRNGGIEILKTVANLLTVNPVGVFPDLENFLARSLAFLCEQPSTMPSVLSNFGSNIFLFLLTRGSETEQYAARGLACLSVNETFRRTLLSENAGPALLECLKNTGRDVFLKRFVLRALASLSDTASEFGALVDTHFIETVIDMALVNDTQMNVHAAHILASLTSDITQLPRITVHLSKIIEIVNLTQIGFEWEISLFSIAENPDSVSPPSHDSHLLSYYFTKIIANILNNSGNTTKSS